MKTGTFAFLAVLVPLSVLPQSREPDPAAAAAFRERYGLQSTKNPAPARSVAASLPERRILAWRLHVLGASREPYRKVNGKAYNLNALFTYTQRIVDDPAFAESAPALSGELANWGILFGTVLQALDKDGILLKKYGDPEFEGESHIVRLKNFPREKQLVDGSKLAMFAYFDGRYSYLNTGGARSTVESYDYGKLVTGDELEQLKSKFASETAARQEVLQKTRVQQEKTQMVKRQEAAKRVVDFYSQKATDGDGNAQLRLGEIYLRGQGVETNLPLARQRLSMALTNGCPQAANLLREIELNSRPSQ
jgi:hypothetical protein